MRLLAVALAIFVGCGIGDPDPTEAQIKKDLVGQTFWHEYGVRGPAGGGKRRTIGAEDLQYMGVTARTTDSRAGTQEVEVYLTGLFDSRNKLIQGYLVLDYKKFDQGWRLHSVWAKAGGRPSIPGDPGGKPFSWEMPK
jgi:hypothetical protein